MEESKKTLYEFVAAIIMLMLVECAFGFFVSSHISAFILGEILGSTAAIGFVISLYKSLDKALEMEEKKAMTYSRKMAILRMILMGVVIVIALTFNRHIGVITTFIGMMNVKFGAFLVPLIHKYKKTK